MISTRRAVPATDRFLAFTFGVVFLVVILAIAIWIPEPTGFSYTIFRIVIALAAAGVGAVIPGFLTVSFRNVLRAGGAIALFVIVYFFAPVAIGEGEARTPPPPAGSAKPAAEAWLATLDRGQVGDAYRSMSRGFQERYEQEEMATLVDRERRALGPLVSRKLNATSSMVNPPGQPRGYYQSYGFKTKFANDPRFIYEAVHLYGEGGKWKVAGFFTFVKTADGQMASYEPPD